MSDQSERELFLDQKNKMLQRKMHSLILGVNNPLSIIHFKALQLKTQFLSSKIELLVELTMVDSIIEHSEKIFKELEKVQLNEAD